ncbi:MAG: hypothetical protein I3273_06355 [Candidatus Moeniiplasma glomeromycotorum]|nr:hypothetical protein [Candidatus Moeniiplasma glomeromycotorum]MCE8169707.1 hypothetical protein [Candidatus Moeniiplasma glomeromycotorum]
MKENLKQTFGITLPIPLYEQLLSEVGKGNISKFIRQVIEKELRQVDKKSLRETYLALENCPEYQQEAEEWEKANLENGEY